MNLYKIGYEHVEELTTYFNEIMKINPLSSSEEYELGHRIQKGDTEALNKLVYHNLKFVVSIVKQYRHRGVPFADLISEGNMGLIRAAQKFDPDKGVKFISYAVWWVRNSINECIASYQKGCETVDLDEKVSNEEGDFEYTYDTINEDFEEQLNEIGNRKETVGLLLKCLQERERKILTLFYGLDGGNEMTLDEVGVRMNLTNERVRQIKDDALSKLKCNVLSLSEECFNEYKSLS